AWNESFANPFGQIAAICLNSRVKDYALSRSHDTGESMTEQRTRRARSPVNTSAPESSAGTQRRPRSSRETSIDQRVKDHIRAVLQKLSGRGDPSNDHFHSKVATAA